MGSSERLETAPLPLGRSLGEGLAVVAGQPKELALEAK